MSGGSFSQGLGEWVGSAEVYDGAGRFAGMGRDTRTVRADDRAGRVTVDVSFEGPFSLAGAYTIADHGKHRTYEGPLNLGLAEVLGDGLVATHNYWPSLGLSQRLFLMVLPGGNHQLSLALLSRGEQLRWTVVGEYRRQLRTSQSPATPAPPPLEREPIDPHGGSRTLRRSRSQHPPPGAETRDPAAASRDPSSGRGQLLLLRPGRWSGRLHRLDGDLEPSGTVDCSETLTPAASGPATAGGEAMKVRLCGLGFASDASFTLESDGSAAWTGTGDNVGSAALSGDVAGSAALSGGRGLSGHFHHDTAGCRVWRREVASLDGSTKAVLHIWYRGEQRLGAVYGTMGFDPA